MLSGNFLRDESELDLFEIISCFFNLDFFYVTDWVSERVEELILFNCSSCFLERKVRNMYCVDFFVC